MIKYYVLLEDVNYNNNEIIGISTSKEKAIKLYLKIMERDNSHVGWCGIQLKQIIIDEDDSVLSEVYLKYNEEEDDLLPI
jgi:hypothetical protein